MTRLLVTFIWNLLKQSNYSWKFNRLVEQWLTNQSLTLKLTKENQEININLINKKSFFNNKLLSFSNLKKITEIPSFNK